MSNKKISYDDILRNMGTYVVDGKLYIIQNAKTEQQEYEQSKMQRLGQGQRQRLGQGQGLGEQVPPSLDTSYAPIMQSNSNLSSNFRDKFIKPMQSQGEQRAQGQPINKNQAIQNYLNMIKSKNHVKNVKSTKMNF